MGRTPRKRPANLTPERLLLESANKTERELAKEYKISQTRINQLKNRAKNETALAILKRF